MKQRRVWPIITLLLVMPLMIVGAYMTAYYALRDPYVTIEYADGSIGPAYYDLNPHETYGPGDKLVDYFFWPAHLIANRFRSSNPDYE